MLPQGLALVGTAAGQQECPGGALAEPGGEQGGAADLPGDEVAHLVRVEDGGLGEGVGERGVVEVRVREAEHDAVVRVHGLDVHAEPLTQPCGQAHRPRGVHARAERGVDRDLPVPELVVEALDQEGAVVREVAGGVLLLLEVGDEVGGGVRIQSLGAEPCGGVRAGGGPQFTHVLPDGAAQFRRPAERVCLPEGEAAGLAGGGGDEHPIVGDVLDPPGGRAEEEHVPHARLVHHLLVELADPAAGPLPGGEEHAEQPAVRDRPAGGDGEALGAGPAGEGAARPVPYDAGAEFGELVGGVEAGEHVQD